MQEDNNLKEEKNIIKNIIRIILFITAVTLIIVGLENGGFRDVMNKAIRICFECIGIG
ncbi:CD1871A family CXXC motif-containing protein [Eubacterium ruminantium]|uniref:CD1871A family CXXC motif-containing protein n=1 Tax=Eubacterium ruminantium TaxID=42322 RepID=UPI001568B7B3|nr:CD1871A family CXXC motif-containing protein [Eubacterium ruminantium]